MHGTINKHSNEQRNENGQTTSNYEAIKLYTLQADYFFCGYAVFVALLFLYLPLLHRIYGEQFFFVPRNK